MQCMKAESSVKAVGRPSALRADPEACRAGRLSGGGVTAGPTAGRGAAICSPGPDPRHPSAGSCNPGEDVGLRPQRVSGQGGAQAPAREMGGGFPSLSTGSCGTGSALCPAPVPTCSRGASQASTQPPGLEYEPTASGDWISKD